MCMFVQKLILKCSQIYIFFIILVSYFVLFSYKCSFLETLTNIILTWHRFEECCWLSHFVWEFLCHKEHILVWWLNRWWQLWNLTITFNLIAVKIDSNSISTIVCPTNRQSSLKNKCKWTEMPQQLHSPNWILAQTQTCLFTAILINTLNVRVKLLPLCMYILHVCMCEQVRWCVKPGC